MLLQGTILYYNPSTRVGSVETISGIFQATNYLFPADQAYPAAVNSFLVPSEYNTVFPSHTFNETDKVVLYKDSFENLIILGRINSGNSTTTTQPFVLYQPGKFTVTKLLTVQANVPVELKDFANRALVRKVKITKVAGGEFTFKILNTNEELQASWGDGEVILENVLEDYAGFFFEATNFTCVLLFNTSGTYELEIVGERFS
jgi:hypothetical protein